MRRRGLRYCARCRTHVVAQGPSRSAKALCRAYFLVPLVLVPVFPFLAGDYVISLPTMMVYMFGTGPVLAVLRRRETCADCGRFIPREQPPPISAASWPA